MTRRLLAAGLALGLAGSAYAGPQAGSNMHVSGTVMTTTFCENGGARVPILSSDDTVYKVAIACSGDDRYDPGDQIVAYGERVNVKGAPVYVKAKKVKHTPRTKPFSFSFSGVVAEDSMCMKRLVIDYEKTTSNNTVLRQEGTLEQITVNYGNKQILVDSVYHFSPTCPSFPRFKKGASLTFKAQELDVYKPDVLMTEVWRLPNGNF